jgi:hypothetical protein
MIQGKSRLTKLYMADPSSLLVEDGKSGTRFPNRITTPAPTSPAPSRRSLAVAVAHLQSYALCKSLIIINL